MKEILDRLHEKRQIELAKSILEANGYRVTKKLNEASQANDGWEYWEMPEDFKGPFEYPQYTKRYSDEILGFVYPPYRSDNPRIESIDDYHAELYDDKRGEIIDSEDFSTLEDAQEYVDELAYRESMLSQHRSKQYVESTDMDEEVETRRSETGNWDEDMKSGAFPIGKDQLRSFYSYLRSKGYAKDQKKRPKGEMMYINSRTGDKVFISKTWYGNYHVEKE